MGELPIGTVTFLFTDLEGSTRLWEEDADAMRVAVARHDALLNDAIARHGGVVFSNMGDGMAAAFASAQQGIAAAVDAQLALSRESWGTTRPLRARMGLHAGDGTVVGGQYDSQPLNRCARLMAVAHGGQIVVSDAVEVLVRGSLPSDVGLVDLGEHRLRDLAQPMRVFQATHPRLAERFPTLSSLDAFPGNLPLQVSSFIGRDQEIVRTIDALDRARVVTLTGVGGVGKTRLAYQVAAEVLPRFRDGAWLVELAPVRDPDDVVETFAALFGVTPHAGETLEQALIEFLRAKQLLLVVDNCEHLLEAVADLIDVIERSCPRVVVLATSREGLALEGEQMLAVPSLRPPGDAADPEAIARSDAVQLFVERAQAADADFRLDNGNVAAVAQVCRRLDGVPLAIELAAARIITMSPSELAAALDRRFEVLAGGRRRAVKRHQTLRATIDWSYDLLDESHRRLLARLAVFAGGCARDAAQAVCAGDPVEPAAVFELLADLVARSLVVVDRGGPDTRYRLLETIREYAEERLAEHDETMALRDQHARYFADRSRIMSEGLIGPDQVLWGQRFRAEEENLLAAMAHALDAHDVDLAMRLVPMQLPGFQLRYILRTSADSVLLLPGAHEHPSYPLALVSAAWQAVNRGELTLAEQLVERALEAERSLSEPAQYIVPLEAQAELVLIRIATATGAWPDVFRLSLSQIDLLRAGGLGAFAAPAFTTAATALCFQGKFDAAVTLATEGLDLARSHRVTDQIITSLWALALSLSEREPVRARAVLQEAVDVFTALGEEGWVAQMMALTAARLADWELTAQLARSCIRYFHWMGVRPSLAGMFTVTARVLADTDPEAAAVVQGAARIFVPGGSAATGIDTSPRSPTSGTDLWTAIRHDTTRRLHDMLGDDRRRDLQAQGAGMNGDDAVSFALTHLDKFVAHGVN
jgi:predicted ATPase/class 3 adenylate cyclase